MVLKKDVGNYILYFFMKYDLKDQINFKDFSLNEIDYLLLATDLCVLVTSKCVLFICPFNFAHAYICHIEDCSIDNIGQFLIKPSDIIDLELIEEISKFQIELIQKEYNINNNFLTEEAMNYYRIHNL